nr:MAG TPA: hypothetical protein [Caudoviricetes sp.]DAG45334.1 MAG TPA: hypothetical protein [Caudoviricetes sp.]DAQ64947.1 MAG TPA: hypothetical protein [Bacteriophage sp.]
MLLFRTISNISSTIVRNENIFISLLLFLHYLL